MKKINLRLTKNSRIVTAESDTHNYITNSHWLIKYNKNITAAELFTAGSNNRLKEYQDKIETIDVETVQGLIDNVIDNNSTEILQDTQFYKQDQRRSNQFMKVFYSTSGGYQYFNNHYINLLSDDLVKFNIYHLSNALRPVVFDHKAKDVTFLITPMRVAGDGGGFKIEKK